MLRRNCINRFLLWLMVLSAVPASSKASTDTERPPLVYVRTSCPWIKDAIAAGSEVSPTFHGLLEEIEASHTFVFVDPTDCWFEASAPCTLVGSTGSGGRFLGVRATRTSSTWHLVEILAHEFQHVVEILQAPEVVDRDSLRALYRRIGFLRREWGIHEGWETMQAQQTQRTVVAEVADYRRHVRLTTHQQ
jgi:hypothetical protein